MLNMLRADVYRLLHTKGFWVLQGVMVGVDFVRILAGFLIHHLPGTVAQVFQKGNDQLYIYYILPIILIVLGADFKYHTLKNIISEGLTFSKYIFFKLASYRFVIFIIILECYLLPCFFSLIFSGLGNWTLTLSVRLIYKCLVSWFILCAVSVVTYFVLLLTKSRALSMITAILAPIVVLLWHAVKPELHVLNYVDLLSCITTMEVTGFSNIGNDLPGIIGSAFLIITGCLGSYYYVNHMDL